jgi:hypothetical protein
MGNGREDLVDYFIKHTDQRLLRIENKVDQLLKFKWQIIGGAAVISFVVTICVQAIQFLIRG